MTRAQEPLTDDERAAIRSLTEQPAWKILEDRVWMPQMWRNITTYRQATTDHRYLQGFDAGFQYAQQCVNEAVKPKPDVIGTGTVNPIDESAFYKTRNQ